MSETIPQPIIQRKILFTPAYNQNIIADKKAIQSKAYDLLTVPWRDITSHWYHSKPKKLSSFNAGFPVLKLILPYLKNKGNK